MATRRGNQIRHDPIQRLLGARSTFQSFLRRRLGNKALAEDLLQQCLLRAIEHQHSLRHDKSLVAWFYRILRHAIIDYARLHATEARGKKAFLQALQASGDDKVAPIDEVKATVCACLYVLLPTLRPSYAELIRRIDLEGEAPKRVAQELKISSNNLAVRVHRARQALRASLVRFCGPCSKHGYLACTCERKVSPD